MKTTVTFIPGMFGPIINAFLGTYFIDQMEYLNTQGTPYEVMPVDTTFWPSVTLRVGLISFTP
jgi:hypothetical protein